MKKRLGIFLFFDKDGRADRYIRYLLESIRPSLDHLITIINGSADGAASAMLSELSDEVIKRENVGLDIAAWKTGITEVCGREKLNGYDTLVLFNDSFFGPFYPFEDIFSEMDNRELDLWGLSVHGAVDGSGLCPYGYRPRYIQTYFLVFEKKLLHSMDFYSFWEKQPLYTNYNEAAEKFVAVLTQQFADLGYKWGVLCDTAEYESGNRARNFDNHSFNLYAMIADMRYPVIKRRSFYIGRDRYLTYSNGSDLFRSLEYVEKNYDYDVSMIFEHIVRKYDPYDVKTALGLDYVLPERCDAQSTNRSIIVARLVCEDRFEQCVRYLSGLPEEVDAVIFTDTDEKKNRLVSLCENTGIKGIYHSDGVPLPYRKISGYRYMCFVHDYEPSERDYSTVIRDTERIAWENTVGSPGYIRSVTELMDRKPYLGLLTPFRPHHGRSADPHDNSKETLSALADIVGVRPDTGKINAAGSSCFWCRTEIMADLTDHAEELKYDQSDMMRVLPYTAAKLGLATGWIYSVGYAGYELTNQRYTADSLLERLGRQGVRTDNLEACLRSVGSKGGRKTEKKTGRVSIDRDEIKDTVKKMLPAPLKALYYKIRYGDRS